MVKEGPSHPCRRGQTTWTLTEKIGKFTVILSRSFHFAILLLSFKAFFWLCRWILSIVCKSSFFIQNVDMKGNCLFWDYFWIAFLPPSLEKPFFSNLGGFLVTVPSLVQRALCMSIFSPKLPILVINLLMALVSSLLVCFSAKSLNIASNFCRSNSYGQVSIHLAHFGANLYQFCTYFRLSITHGSFSLNLVQNSTIFISLVVTFIFF